MKKPTDEELMAAVDKVIQETLQEALQALTIDIDTMLNGRHLPNKNRETGFILLTVQDIESNLIDTTITTNLTKKEVIRLLQDIVEQKFSKEPKPESKHEPKGKT